VVVVVGEVHGQVAVFVVEHRDEEVGVLAGGNLALPATQKTAKTCENRKEGRRAWVHVQQQHFSM
jgi:hypothetical protein